MDKYYLLVFNQGWANEHSVPALACFVESEYHSWCAAPMGRINIKYPEQLAKFEEKVAASTAYAKLRVQYMNSPNDEVLAAEFNGSKAPPYIDTYRDRPRKFNTCIRAYLGNSGQGFGEDFRDYETGNDLVKAGLVYVMEVDESFNRIFRQAHLSSLSLCNVFTVNPESDWPAGLDEDDDEGEE